MDFYVKSLGKVSEMIKQLLIHLASKKLLPPIQWKPEFGITKPTVG